MDYLTFTDRETYLKARTAWRKVYADLSNAIRELKHERANAARAGTGNPAQYMVCRMKKTATTMLETRQVMKEQSAAQRLAGLENREAA